MTKTNKLVWRLGKLPTIEEILLLVTSKLITQDEAKEILFNQSTEEGRDKKSLEEEIKFLRSLVEKMADRSQIVTTIKEIAMPGYYNKYPWYRPYEVWCGSGETNLCASTIAGTTLNAFSNQIIEFSAIQTF